MKVYGYTNPESGYSASYSNKVTRDSMCSGILGVHLWEHEIPDKVALPPENGIDPPLSYGSVIIAEINHYGTQASIVLARVGSPEFPWVGLDPGGETSVGWATRVIKSWKPLRTTPSADVLSQFLFQTQGYLMQDEDADSLAAFIRQEMTK